MTLPERAPLRKRASDLTKKGWVRLRGGALTPRRAAASAALGAFIGCVPVFGLHLPLCVGLCLPLRLDAPVAYLFANVSNPLVAPWLVFAEVQVGAYLLSGQPAPFDIDAARDVGVVGFVSFAAAGTVVVGAVVAALSAAMAGGLTLLWKRR